MQSAYQNFKTNCTVDGVSNASSTRPLAQCSAVANDKISVVHTDDGGLWLLNDTTTDIKLKPCELFGFGMGAYVPKAAGQVNALDCI